MPRYFFHVMDGRIAIDTVGLEFAGDPEARHEALRAVGDMVIDREMDLWLGNTWSMTVADDSGTIICNLRFSIDRPQTRR